MTASPSLVVRPALFSDAAAVAHVQVTGWREAYTGRMPQTILDGLDEERATRQWGEVIAGRTPLHSDMWVAEQGGAVVGFVSSGACRDPDATPGRPEIYALYVLAAHYGTGVGQGLLDAAIGDAAASLWVLADNPRARAFYTRNGFAPDGATKDDDRWGDAIHEVRMVRAAA